MQNSFTYHFSKMKTFSVNFGNAELGEGMLKTESFYVAGTFL